LTINRNDTIIKSLVSYNDKRQSMYQYCKGLIQKKEDDNDGTASVAASNKI